MLLLPKVMENYYFKKFKRVITIVSNHQDPRLSATRQQAIKEKVLAQISHTPQNSGSIVTSASISKQNWGLRSMRLALVIILLLVVGSGTSYAAASAQPGDLLYSVKLFGETAELKLSISDEAKAEQLAKIAERRLDENLELQVYTVAIPKSEQDNSDDLSSKSNRKLTAQQAEKAAAESQERFQQAMETLKKTQAKLEEKGNQAAAEAVRDNLKRLEERSREFNHEPEDDSINEGDDAGKVEGLSDDNERANESGDDNEHQDETDRQEEYNDKENN